MCCITFNWEKGDAIKKFEYFEKKKSISWAVIELTSYCNFNCAWCYAAVGYKSNLDRRHMSMENLNKLLQSLASAGIKQVTYSGGEPTLYPHIKEAIKKAKDLGMVVHMNTNGFLLNKKLAEELKEFGLSQVEINIDSICPEKHNTIRGKKGSFERTVQALKSAKEAGLMCVSQTVLTKNNEDEIMEIIKFARSLGVQRYRLWDMMPSGSASDKMDLVPLKYMEILRKVSEFANETGAQSIEAGEPLFPLDYDTHLSGVDTYCVCAKGLLLNISVEGDVYFCCTYRKSLYNIFDAIERGISINELHKVKLGEFLDTLKIPSKCFKCGFYDKCHGGCPTRIGYTNDGADYWCDKSNSITESIPQPIACTLY